MIGYPALYPAMNYRFFLAFLFILVLAFPVFAQDMTQEEATKRLEAEGQPLTRQGFEGAVSTNDIENVRLYLEAGFDPNRKIESVDVESAEFYPVGFAVTGGNTELLRVLLEHGADPNKMTFLNRPVHSAVSHPEALEILLDHGARVDALSKTGNQALHSAIISPDTTWYVLNESIRILLQDGADPNAEIQNGELAGANPLLLCALKGRPRAAQILIEHGAKPDLTLENQPSREGPLSAIARQAGNVDTANVLEKAGM